MKIFNRLCNSDFLFFLLSQSGENPKTITENFNKIVTTKFSINWLARWKRLQKKKPRAELQLKMSNEKFSPLFRAAPIFLGVFQRVLKKFNRVFRQRFYTRSYEPLYFTRINKFSPYFYILLLLLLLLLLLF